MNWQLFCNDVQCKLFLPFVAAMEHARGHALFLNLRTFARSVR